jgi:photosystem II oxygen-evolving enhancer protein 3
MCTAQQANLDSPLVVIVQVLSGFLAGAAALTVAKGAEAAATPVDIFDDRAARARGYDIIYEARDLELDQRVRDGMSQARASLEDTKARVKASEARIDADLEPSIKKAYW